MTEEEKVQVEMFCELLNKVLDQLTTVQLASDENGDKARLVEKFLNEPFTKCMTYLERQLVKTNTGYLVGNGLTVADVFATVLLDLIISKKLTENLFEGYPKVKAMRLRVRSVAAIKNWNTAHNQ